MSPLEALALFLFVVVVGLLLVVVAVWAIVWIWRHWRPAGESPPCSICGDPNCVDMGHMAKVQERINALHKARLIQREVVEPAQQQALDVFRFYVKPARPYDWRADRAFSPGARRV